MRRLQAVRRPAKGRRERGCSIIQVLPERRVQLTARLDQVCRAHGKEPNRQEGARPVDGEGPKTRREENLGSDNPSVLLS